MNRPLLADVSLMVGAGERIGLVGPSGCGKSSLLRVMAMLDMIDEGEILFLGHSIREAEVPSYRQRVIYLSQHPSLAIGSVRRNLKTPFRFNSATKQYDESRIVGLLQALNKPASILDQTAEQLSGGEQQLIALIRAIQLEPTILLLDEPTASLDQESIGLVELLIDRWQSENKSRCLVWVSHDRTQLQRTTSRIVSMDAGKLE